jgi:hypothetical protein
LSGTQAHISVLDIVDIVNGDAAPKAPDTNTNPLAEPSVDVVPTVSTDGFSIRMNINAKFDEFTGYDTPASAVPQAGPGPASSFGVPVTPVLPVAHFLVRQASTFPTVFDGQTVVLASGEMGPANQLHLLYFITPRLVDAAGNPVHSDEQIKARQNDVPPQSPASSEFKSP